MEIEVSWILRTHIWYTVLCETLTYRLFMVISNSVLLPFSTNRTWLNGSKTFRNIFHFDIIVLFSQCKISSYTWYYTTVIAVWLSTVLNNQNIHFSRMTDWYKLHEVLGFVSVCFSLVCIQAYGESFSIHILNYSQSLILASMYLLVILMTL